MAPTGRRLAALLAILAGVLTSLTALSASPAAAADAPNCGPDVFKADGTPWVCTMSDEFDGTSLDTTKWATATTDTTGLAQGGACYTSSPDNVAVADGTLQLTVRNVSTPVTCKASKGLITTNYTAGQVSTFKKFSQQYGRFTVRAKFPAATVAGLHSAIWMWPQNPYSTQLIGEIDVAEIYSKYNDRAIPYLHYLYEPKTVSLSSNTNIYTNNYCGMDVTGFHDYTVEWTPSTFKVIYDDRVCLQNNLRTLGASPFDQPYFLILTQALGVANNAFNANTPLPATTQVDWVHIWK